jgi:hypothetical protein
MSACERGNQVELGRWMTPDPLGGDVTNPQSLNRYAYALNNPTTFVDPLGLCGEPTTVTFSGNYSANVTGYPSCDSILSTWGYEWNCMMNISSCPSYNGMGLSMGGSGSGGGGGGVGQSTSWLTDFSSAPARVKCSGSARVLQGNAATIGKPGGFSGPSVGVIPVTADGAAVIPSQWGGKAALRPHLTQIRGIFPSVNYSFTGVVDVMGGAPPAGFPPGSNVQTDLMQLNPGRVILELPGAPQDFGTTGVTITAPSAVGCPAGTVQVP